MKPLPLLTASAALLLFSAPAAAQQGSSVFGARNQPPPSSLFGWDKGHGHHRGFGGFIIVQREVPVIVEKVVVKEAPPPQAVPLPQNSGGGDKVRKPYVIGASYASLPQPCMKLIEEGVSYYYCSGEWYREVRSGRDPLYRAVKRQL